MYTKRGQQGSAAGATVLLVVIAVVIVMFVILIPPADRAELLGTPNSGSGNGISGSNGTGARLVDVAPGRIDFIGQTNVEHPMPAVTLQVTTQSQQLGERASLSVRRGIFTKAPGEMTFSLDNPSITDRILLGFVVEESQGPVQILLNGQVVFDGELTVGNTAPLSLPKSMLSSQNTISFVSASPGIIFWRTNHVILRNVKVLADVTQTDSQLSHQTFLVSDTEKIALEKMVLKFQPDCQFNTVGRLSVTVNNHEIYNAVPDCELAMVPIEFAPSIVISGGNDITFRTEKGNYFLSHVVLQSRLKAIDYPTYYFELSHEDFQAVHEGGKDVRVSLYFVDVVDSKQVDLFVNGHINQFDTKDKSYSFSIGDDIEEGNNAVKVKPRRSLEVRRLLVELVNK